MNSGTGFRVDRLRVSYGGQRVLDDTSGTFHAGRMSAIVGPNGAGKSTLVKAMLGLIPIDRGTVTLFGDPVRRHCHRIAYVPQRSDIDWSYPATVAEVTGMGRYPLGRLWRRTSARDREQVRDALRTVSLAGFEDRAIGALSGGQQQRVFLARAIAQEAAVVVLDIPLLYETGGEARVDLVAVVSAPPFVQRRRALRRPGMTPAKFASTVARQVPDREKRRRADFVIPSGLGRRPTLQAIRRLLTLVSDSAIGGPDA